MSALTTIAVFICCLLSLHAVAAETNLVNESPVAIKQLANGHYLVDFGRVSFANIRLKPHALGELKVHFGEDIKGGRINRAPEGTVRYQSVLVSIANTQEIRVAPVADQRNTEGATDKHPPAILTPPAWGVVMPFRWVEIEGWQGDFTAEHITRQSAYLTAWNDAAAHFHSTDSMLNSVWDLCKYSIKATSFAGVYVDGDRERIPYEADAYLNQLSHYYTDNDKQMARDTIDHLMIYGTWPSEWAPHMVFMVHADWLHTGDKAWMAARYESLKGKMLLDRVRENGLVYSEAMHIKKNDIVDWPVGERDNYVFTEYNTVVNAFYLRTLMLMKNMAEALGKTQDAADFSARYTKSHEQFQRAFFNPKTGLYVDGQHQEHSSIHANLFPLAFGLVPPAQRQKVTQWLANSGMKCSVYAAQYLLEALFDNGADKEAVALMLAEGDRSWKHMLQTGTTITFEAWDNKYKKNQDWNHAWGAAPANLLPRYILGAQPQSPGWEVAKISPKVSGLAFVKGIVPTIKGGIAVEWTHTDKRFQMHLTLPEGVAAQVDIPRAGKAKKVIVNGQSVGFVSRDGRLHLKQTLRGNVDIEVR